MGSVSSLRQNGLRLNILQSEWRRNSGYDAVPLGKHLFNTSLEDSGPNLT